MNDLNFDLHSLNSILDTDQSNYVLFWMQNFFKRRPTLQGKNLLLWEQILSFKCGLPLGMEARMQMPELHASMGTHSPFSAIEV